MLAKRIALLDGATSRAHLNLMLTMLPGLIPIAPIQAHKV